MSSETRKLFESFETDKIKSAIEELGLTTEQLNVISYGNLEKISRLAGVSVGRVMEYLAMERPEGKYHIGG